MSRVEGSHNRKGGNTVINRLNMIRMIIAFGCLAQLVNNLTVFRTPIDCFDRISLADKPQQFNQADEENQSVVPSSSSRFLWGDTDVRKEETTNRTQSHSRLYDLCESVMRRIRQINDCSRSPDCRHTHSFEDLPQPLLNHAYFKGQGFGRLIEHSVATCLVAASVGRPCMVDMTPRDPYYVFRSFIRPTLDVSIESLASQNRNHKHNSNPDHAMFGNRPMFEKATVDEIMLALSKLQRPQYGKWTKGDLEDVMLEHVLPLGDLNYTGNPVEALLINPRKIAISPNWGDSWFAQPWDWPSLSPKHTENSTDYSSYETSGHMISSNTSVQYRSTRRTLRVINVTGGVLRSRSGTVYLSSQSVSDQSPLVSPCQRHQDPRLVTYMQNYMYQPTALLSKLHSEHKSMMLGEDPRNVNLIEEPYGAIHLRFQLMQLSKRFPSEKEGPEAIESGLQKMASKLYDCLQLQHEKWRNQDLPQFQKWWLVTDKLSFGRNLTHIINELDNSKSAIGTQHQTFSHLKIVLEDVRAVKDGSSQTPLQKIMSHRQNGEIAHSLTQYSTGPLGHEYMASSMLDWMVLHESKVALITDGAFAGSGARGNGKYFRHFSRQENIACSGFRLFHA